MHYQYSRRETCTRRWLASGDRFIIIVFFFCLCLVSSAGTPSLLRLIFLPILLLLSCILFILFLFISAWSTLPPGSSCACTEWYIHVNALWSKQGKAKNVN